MWVNFIKKYQILVISKRFEKIRIQKKGTKSKNIIIMADIFIDIK